MLNKPTNCPKRNNIDKPEMARPQNRITQGTDFNPTPPDILSSIHIDSQYILQQHYLQHRVLPPNCSHVKRLTNTRLSVLNYALRCSFYNNNCHKCAVIKTNDPPVCTHIHACYSKYINLDACCVYSHVLLYLQLPCVTDDCSRILGKNTDATLFIQGFHFMESLFTNGFPVNEGKHTHSCTHTSKQT